MKKIKALIIITKYFIIISSIKIVFCNKITLKIKGSGNSSVLGNNENVYFKKIYFPNKVLINDNEQNSVEYYYYFEHQDNTVELIWNNTISSCHNIFLGCRDIYEIDLSEFDSTDVTSIQSMFNRCTSLISINFKNFDTSKITKMYKLFYNCTSLKSLNLENFNTSKVTNMTSMFDGCSSLTSLNLSNFDFSKISKVNKMFNNNRKLEYINIINIHEKNELSSSYENMFENVPENIVICIDKKQNKNHIFPQISQKSFYIIDCSDDWKLKQKNIIIESGICNENNEKFKFKRHCCTNCVDENLDDLIYICKYEQELNGDYSDSNIFCNKCNNNSFPKEDDASNTNNLFNCYINPKSYYLDTNIQIYKKCYNTCENCNISVTK